MAKAKRSKKHQARSKVSFTDKKHTAALHLLAKSCCYGHAKSVLAEAAAGKTPAESVGNKLQLDAASDLLKECKGKLAVATHAVTDWQESGFGGWGGTGGWPGD
jgi:hypothetical protein